MQLDGAIDLLDVEVDSHGLVDASRRYYAAMARRVEPAKTRPGSTTRGVADRSFRYWAVANFSLIPVIVLAVIMTIFAFNDVAARRREVDETIRILLQHQRETARRERASPSPEEREVEVQSAE